MKSKSKLRWMTKIKITALDLDGKVKDVTEIKNLLMNVGLNMVREGWRGALNDLEIKDMAWGSDNTPPAVGQTGLIAETDSQTMTTQVAGGTGELISTVYLNPSTANAPPDIEELGWFAGALADGTTPNPGIMVGRVLYSRAKTNLESLQIQRTDTIAEA